MRASILTVIDTIYETLCIFGFRSEEKADKESRTRTIDHWLSLAREVGWIKVTKYKLACFYSFITKTTLPKNPFPIGNKDLPNHLIGGRAGNFLTLFFKREDKVRKYQLLNTILIGIKKGLPKPDQQALEKDKLETVDILSTKPDTPSETDTKVGHRPQAERSLAARIFDLDRPEEDKIGLKVIRRELERTVDELFPPIRKDGEWNFLTDEERFRAFVPSTSANYLIQKRNMGALGWLLEPENPALLGGKFGKEEWMNLRTPGGAVRKTENTSQEEEIESEINQPELPKYENRFKELWRRLLKIAVASENIAKPVPLAEPLKIRIITKGNPARMTVLRCLQKRMHSTLRKHPVFELTGTPITLGYIQRQIGTLKPEEVYLSGDYSAATNNLHSWVSECIANKISSNLGLTPVERKLFIESLTKHMIEKEENTFVEQKRGQLMGSITSFPVLCIANAALCRYAYEQSRSKEERAFGGDQFLAGPAPDLDLADCPMAINGDDVVIRGNKHLYKLWKEITEFVGLSESVGKTYVSDEFLQMNSTCYITTTPYEATDVKFSRNVQTTLKEVGYVNWGLIKGITKSEAGRDKGLNDHTKSIGTQFKELKKLTPPDLWPKVYDLFKATRKKEFSQLKLPWYIPEWLGGLGLEGEASQLDLRIAQGILYNLKEAQPKNLGVGKKEWKMFDLATKRIAPGYQIKEWNEGVELFDQTILKECINLMFDSNVRITDIKEPSLDMKEFQNYWVEWNGVTQTINQHAKEIKQSNNGPMKKNFKEFVEQSFIAAQADENWKGSWAVRHNQMLWNPDNPEWFFKTRGLPKPIQPELLEKYKTFISYQKDSFLQRPSNELESHLD
jgi:hypothetical protein